MAAVNRCSILIRSLSTSQSVKPPIQVFGLEGRYATSLYTAASKLKQLDQVEKDLVAIQKTLKKDVKLRESVTSPIINKKLLATTLQGVSETLRMATATGNFLSLMANNGRLQKLDTVINSFKIIMAAHRGEIICEVVSAKPLDSSQNKQLENALKAFLKGNESLKITQRVDPSIIGGLIVSIGDRYIDMSIASKIKMYTDVITTAA